MENNPDLDAQSEAYFNQMKHIKHPDIENLTLSEKIKLQRNGYNKLIPAGGKPEDIFRVLEKNIRINNRAIPLKILLS